LRRLWFGTEGRLIKAAFQLTDTASQFGQPAYDCGTFLPGGVIAQWEEACVMPWLTQTVSDHGGRRYIHAVGNLQMAKNARTTANRAAPADLGAASHARASGHGSVVADPDVMADLYLIVELDSIADDGIGQCATINRGVCADFHVVSDHDTASLRNFDPLFAVSRKAKPISANDNAGVKDAARADL